MGAHAVDDQAEEALPGARRDAGGEIGDGAHHQVDDRHVGDEETASNNLSITPRHGIESGSPLTCQPVDPATTAWLEGMARRSVGAQLAEGARMDSRARELVGFVGIVLGLLATAASQSGAANGLWGGLFRFFAIVAVAALLYAALHVMQKLVLRRAQFRDIGPGAIAGYLRDPELVEMELEEIQARAVYDLSAAAELNAELIAQAREDFAAGYGYFAVGLAAAALAIVALILALI